MPEDSMQTTCPVASDRSSLSSPPARSVHQLNARERSGASFTLGTAGEGQVLPFPDRKETPATPPCKQRAGDPDVEILAWVDPETALLAQHLGGFERIHLERFSHIARIMELERELQACRKERDRLRNPRNALIDWLLANLKRLLL